MIQKIRSYVTASARWQAAGKPTRTDEQVLQILGDHCSTCEWFAESRCTHKDCGCRIVKPSSERHHVAGWLLPRAMLNKLRMATERCPVSKWQ